jgi:hypothetical protein
MNQNTENDDLLNTENIFLISAENFDLSNIVNIDLISNIVEKKLIKYNTQTLTLIVVIENILEVVEITKLKGSYKKTLSLKLIQKFIGYCPEKYKVLKHTIQQGLDNGLISDTIDLVVKASNNELNINNIKVIVKSNYFKKLVLNCFYFFSKKKLL